VIHLFHAVVPFSSPYACLCLAIPYGIDCFSCLTLGCLGAPLQRAQRVL
jgi:hypothetical protein